MGLWTITSCLASVAVSTENVAVSTMPADWELVARSDAVVSAQLSMAGPIGNSVQIDLRDVNVIAGHAQGSEINITLEGLGQDEIGRIGALQSERVIVFLGAYHDRSGKLQLADDPESALRKYSAEFAKRVKEVAHANQAAFSRAQARKVEYCSSGGDLQRRVRELVDRLGGESEDVDRSVESLLALGREAVPYIVCELERAKGIPVRSLKVRVGDRGFEEYAHYTPEEKVDILDMVLTSITGASFGSIVNGATAAQRERAIRGWWVYLGRLMSEDGGAAKPPG